jgi:hypothetical protein
VDGVACASRAGSAVLVRGEEATAGEGGVGVAGGVAGPSGLAGGALSATSRAGGEWTGLGDEADSLDDATFTPPGEGPRGRGPAILQVT